MSLERFKCIEGYGDKYLVSSWGNVYKVIGDYLSLDAYSQLFHKIIEIKPQKSDKGYLRVRLIKDGKKKWHKVHRLVAQAFIENPDNKPQINHKDGNKKNNSVTNLEWVTDEENKAHQKEILSKERPYE